MFAGDHFVNFNLAYDVHCHFKPAIKIGRNCGCLLSISLFIWTTQISFRYTRQYTVKSSYWFRLLYRQFTQRPVAIIVKILLHIQSCWYCYISNHADIVNGLDDRQTDRRKPFLLATVVCTIYRKLKTITQYLSMMICSRACDTYHKLHNYLKHISYFFSY